MEYDAVKAEKADAMRRFNRKRQVFSCLRLVGAFSLLFYSCKWLPTVASSPHASLFNHPVYAFLLINVIGFLIYRLSAGDHNTKNDVPPDLYDQYVSFSPRPETTTTITPTTTCDGDEQQPVEEEAAPVVPEEKSPTGDQDVTCKEIVARRGPVDDIGDHHAVSPDRTRRYRRSKSEKGGGGGWRRELRRSETELVGRKSVDEMDSEEFRREIERFIADKKKTLRDENIAMLSVEQKREPMAITYK